MIEQMTTMEMKWGMYVTVCSVRLKRSPRSSLSISARSIGAGKPHRIEYRLMRNVLRSMRKK